MKKYLILFLLFLTFGAVKAQTNDLASGYNNDTDAGRTYGNLTQTGGTGSSGEFTNTDALGVTTDVTWSIVGTTLSWSVDVEAPTGAYLHLHRLWITYDEFSSDPEDSVVDDDFEDDGPSTLGFGSDHWTSSGSAELRSSPNTLYFSFENYAGDETYDQNTNEVIRGNLYY